MPSLDDLVAQHNQAKPLSLDEALAQQEAPADDWKPTEYGFKVRPIDLGNGKQSVEREDGFVYFGPDQGNTGKPGWFDSKGMRGGDTPKASVGIMDRLTNNLQQKERDVSRLPLAGQVIPAQVSGMAKGLVDTVTAPAQLVAHAFGSNVMDAPVDAIQRGYEQNWQQSAPGEMIGQTIPFLATAGGTAAPQAVGPLQKALAYWRGLGPVAKGAATGAVMAPLAAPETGVQSEGDFWKRKGTKAAIGAGTGTVFGAFGSVANRLSSKLTPEAQAVADLGDQFGVRTLASDLTANKPGLAKAAVLAESIPGSGMVKQRVAQQGEARAAAEKLLAQHGIEGEVPTTIQKGLTDHLGAVKGQVREAYDKVAKLAEGLGDVPMDQTLAEIQRLKAAESSAVVPDQGIIALLEKMESRLTGGEANLGYTGVRGLRSDLGSMVSDYYKGTNATTGSKGVQVLQGVKKAVEDDLSAFTTKAGGDVAKAAREADALYSKQLVPLKDRVIVTATKNSEPDQIYKTIVAAGPGRAQKFYNAMAPEGRAAVRANMLRDAYAAATKQDGVFSPAQFAKELESIKDATGVFFKGKDKFELDGFVNLMRHVQRAGQVNENPPTGQRVLMGLLAGEGAQAVGTMFGRGAEAATPAFGTMAAGAAGARALTKLFASEAGKKFLLGASMAKPGTPAMEKLLERDLPRLLGGNAMSSAPLQQLPAAASTGTQEQIAQQ